MRKMEEYGNNDGFKMICQHCGNEVKVRPIVDLEDKWTKTLTLETKCSCGNSYVAVYNLNRFIKPWFNI